MAGGRGRETLEGDPGREIVWARPRRETLEGDPGRETVWARPRLETLEGDPGPETLLGPTYGVKP